MIDLLARRSVWFLCMALVLALCAIPFALRLEMTTDLIHLLPSELPSVSSFRQFEERIGGHTFLSIVIEGPDPAANVRFGDALARRLAARDWAYQVHFRKNIDFVRKRLPFLIPESDLERLEGDLREALTRAKTRHSPLSIDLDEEPVEPDWKWLRALTNLQEIRSNGDGTILLMQVQMSQLTSRVKKTRVILAQAAEDIGAVGPASFHPALKARPYGGLRFRIEEYNAIVRDLTLASFITLPLMLLIPALALRSCWEPLVVLVPVGIGMAWTYGAAQLLFGSLNLVTSFLFLILFGIGDDYPIHLLYRIREEIEEGAGVRQATGRALRSTIAPLIFCVLTALSGFLSLAWMQFRGFSQFGAIAGMGVCLIFAATLLTVPGIVWLIRFRLGDRGVREPEVRSESRSVPRWRSALLVVSLWAVLAGAGGWIIHDKLEFEQDFERLRPDFKELRELRDKAESIEGFQRSSPAVFFTPDFEVSREITREVQRRFDQQGANSPIGRVISLASIVDGDTPSKRACLERILALIDDPVFRHAPADLQQDIRILREHLDLSPLSLESIPLEIRKSLTRQESEGNGTPRDLYLVVVEPRNRVSLAPEAEAFAGQLEGIQVQGRRYVAAGEALIFAETLRLVKREGFVAIGLAWLATAVLVYMAFRSWSDLIALASTLAVSTSISLAVLALAGVRLSFFNLTVVPLLVGLGINYGIHVLHAYHEKGLTAAHAARRLAASVGSAAATTVVGFAGLLLARHPGLWSMGFTASVGIGMTVLSCLLFLPSLADLLAVLRRRRR
jgi:hypothetical protein